MRLDHLLSKEHHEKHPSWWGVSRVESDACSGRGLGASNDVENKTAGTLLGPEATPCCGVLSPHLVVGCGV